MFCCSTRVSGAATVLPAVRVEADPVPARPAVPLPGGTGPHMSRNPGPVSAQATRSATESVYGIGASSRLNVRWSTPGTCLVSGLLRGRVMPDSLGAGPDSTRPGCPNNGLSVDTVPSSAVESPQMGSGGWRRPSTTGG